MGAHYFEGESFVIFGSMTKKNAFAVCRYWVIGETRILAFVKILEWLVAMLTI